MAGSILKIIHAILNKRHQARILIWPLDLFNSTMLLAILYHLAYLFCLTQSRGLA